MKERRELVERTCSKYGRRLKVPLKLYNKKLRSAERMSISKKNVENVFRFDVEHNLMYCENYKDCHYFRPKSHTSQTSLLQ